MYIDEDGIYCIGKEKKLKITRELIDKLYKELSRPLYISNESLIYTVNVEEKVYKFTFLKENYNLLTYIDENGKWYTVENRAASFIFRVKGQDNERDIFSYKQYEKNLEIFNYSFPWSEDNILTKSFIENKIFENDGRYPIIVVDINFNELKKSENNIVNSFKDLSKYINFYLKDEVELEKYEENNFIDKNIFKIEPDSKINVFFRDNRKLFTDSIINKFIKGTKEFFFTGLHSIGKTFTLLLFKSEIHEQIIKVYFNMEALKTEKFLEIIIYESQKLFDNENKWKDAFIQLKNKISDSNNHLNILYNLIKLFVQKYAKKEIKYVIILDQIKFEKIEDEEYNFINSVRKVIKSSNNVHLIGCCSINYKGVKDILFYNWNKEEKEEKEEKKEKEDDKKEEEEEEENIPELFYVRQSEFFGEKINESNKYLNLLGNIPRFKNIENKLNSKIVNLFLKKIKEKFFKFYGLNEFYKFKKIENIPVTKKFKNMKDFLDKLQKIPFKYFEIDLTQRMFDFSCPIIERAIKEILEEYELKEKAVDNNIELGWYFEKRVIYALRVTNLLDNKYYIDNSYLIPTIFLPHKIEDLNQKENSFFYFEFCNVKRYDCAIYLGKEKALLLIQISIRKPKYKLDEYSNNFQGDLEDLQRFIKKNNLKVNKYYLLFILLYSNYVKEENLTEIRDSGFSYILYDLADNKFKGKIENDLFEIPNTINSRIDYDIDENYFMFGKDNYSFDFEYKGKYHKYYVEKNFSLERFFNEIFDEIIKEEFKKITKFDFSGFYLKSYKSCYFKIFIEDMKEKHLLLNFKNGKIFYGSGTSKKDFSWHSYDLISREKKYIKNEGYYLTMDCFHFKNKK